jgi:hypothetical protein
VESRSNLIESGVERCLPEAEGMEGRMVEKGKLLIIGQKVSVRLEKYFYKLAYISWGGSL